ncbi:hypothetical protein HMPREF3150_04095 [Pseudomonas aeruginosa]|nr:hypothetical protein HMPREF3150_04095 [Pseudomonas aeruginosa]
MDRTMFWYCCAANGRNKKPEPPRTVNGTNDSRALRTLRFLQFQRTSSQQPGTIRC